MCAHSQYFTGSPAHFRSLLSMNHFQAMRSHYCSSYVYVASITAEDLNDFTALYREHCEVRSRISTCVDLNVISDRYTIHGFIPVVIAGLDV